MDMGQQLASLWGEAASPPASNPPQLFHSPWGVFCVGLQVSGGGAVSGHQVVFFTLSVLATLSYMRSQTQQLGSLWSSSHLENVATAVRCGF